MQDVSPQSHSLLLRRRRYSKLPVLGDCSCEGFRMTAPRADRQCERFMRRGQSGAWLHPILPSRPIARATSCTPAEARSLKTSDFIDNVTLIAKKALAEYLINS